MTDRFANGDTSNDTGGLTRRPADHRLRPHRQGLLPGRRHRRPARAARLHRRARHHRDLADAELRQQARAGRGRERVRRVPRLLDHRLHADRPAPRHQRRARRPSSPRRTTAASRSTSTSSPTTRPTSSTTPRASTTYVDQATSPYTATPTAPRSTRPTTPAPTRSRRSTPRRRFPYTPGDRPGRGRTSRSRPGSTTPRSTTTAATRPMTGESTTYGDFDGLDDLMTENPTVVNGFVRRLRAVGRPRHRRVPHRHRQARQLRVLAAVDHPGARLRARPRQARLLHVRRGLRRRRRQAVAVRARHRHELGARLHVPVRRRPRTPRAARPTGCAAVRGRRHVHDADYDRATALPTFLGNHDMGRIGYFLKDSPDAAGALELAHDADVPHARPAGRLLRRRAGLRRQRFAGGKTRTPGSRCSRARSPSTRARRFVDGTTAGSADRYGTDGAALPAHRRARRAARAAPRPSRRARRSSATPTARVYAFSRVDRTKGSSTSSRSTTARRRPR